MQDVGQFYEWSFGVSGKVKQNYKNMGILYQLAAAILDKVSGEVKAKFVIWQLSAFKIQMWRNTVMK